MSTDTKTPLPWKEWELAKEKCRRYIFWAKVFYNRNLFDTDNCSLVGENCHGSGVLCSHTDKCCIYCVNKECNYHLCGCCKARDAILNLWYCEDACLANPDKELWEV